MSENNEFRPIIGIVLDAVGTLIAPTPSVADAYAQAAIRQGIEMDRFLIRERFHRHFIDDEVDEARGPMATDEPRERRRWRRIVGNVLPEVPDLDRAFDELWDHFGRPESWRCFDDVAGSIDRLAEAGFSMRIASNFDARLRGVVGALPELAGLRETLVVSSEVGYRKPHPSFYLAARESLGLPPDRVLFVGDDLENDYRGPRRAGLRAVLIDRDGRPEAAIPTYPGLDELASALVR